MLVTVTNLKSYSINTPDVYPGTAAVGGNVNNGLPHPFGWVGPLTANGTAGDHSVQALHPSDLYFREVMNGSAQTAWEKWQQMIQASVVTLGLAIQADVRAIDEVFLTAL